MEDVKPSASMSNLQYDESGSVEGRFTLLYKNGPSLDENMFTQAMDLFRESKNLLLSNMLTTGTGMPKEIERFWFAFILYTVRRLNKVNGGKPKQQTDRNNFTLCQILRDTKLNVVDFFKVMRRFFLMAGPTISNLYGTDWEKRLETKELQTNIVHLSVLSIYYKLATLEFFLTSDRNDDKQSVDASSTGIVSDYHRFGWLMFLALRNHAFSRFKDLVTCTNGLVSILAILILHVPVRFRKFSFHNSSRFVRKGNKGFDLLASLCNIYDTSEDELRITIEKANNLIVDVLKKKPCLASICKNENLNGIDTDGLTIFEDLMEESFLSSSLIILEKDYDDTIQNKCELDERIFVDDDDSFLGTGSLFRGAKRKFDSLASPTKTITSPLSLPRSKHESSTNGHPVGPNSLVVPALVSTTMATAKWLRNVISPLPSKPSSEVERFLSSGDNDASDGVSLRAHIILKSIFLSGAPGEQSGSLHSANSVDSIWAEQRRMEALKLYYRVLEAICTAESQILHASNLTSLLTNESFHRCMLACSAELVSATHRTVTMLFPSVLERIGITAFDLCMVIESFVRHEESLPRELVRHLNSLEERLLESMVWEKGSSMYNSLIVARPTLSGEINRLGLLAKPMPSLDAIVIHNNITYEGLPPLSFVHKPETLPGQKGDLLSLKRAGGDYRSVLVERNSFTSPVKDCLLAFKSLKSSPIRPNPVGGGETCAETGINVFFSKILKLAAVRINGLVDQLPLSQQVRETVNHFVEQILSQRTTIFFNRHIDQIILCSLYVVAKIWRLNLTFKEIINNYRKLPHCKPQVFRNVFDDGSSTRCHNRKLGQDQVDIITFYSEVFVPSVKPLLMELHPYGATPKSKDQQASQS